MGRTFYNRLLRLLPLTATNSNSVVLQIVQWWAFPISVPNERVPRRIRVYDVLGEIYKNETAEEAEKYLKQAVEAHPLPWTYNRLAELYMKEGREADSLAGVIIALKDSARARRETQAVRETQERYDEVREDAAAEHSLRMWALWAAASAVALLAMSAVYGMARRRYGRKLDESAKRQAEYEHRMVELGKDKRRAETRMRSAEREARRRVEAQAENIAEGRRLYERLTTGGNTDGWTADDYQRLLEYLRTMNAEAVATLESDYERLSPRVMAFAAMTALGYSDDELMRMFNVGASTLRTMKTRLKKKRK